MSINYSEGGANLLSNYVPADVKVYPDREYYLFIYNVPGIKHITYGSSSWKETIEFEVLDFDTDFDSWLDQTIASVTCSTDTQREKMQKICDYVRENFKYDRNDGTYLKTKMEDYSPFWITGRIDCWDATDIMMGAAQKLGLASEVTCAGYAQHYYATVTIDGEGIVFDACPLSSTGIDNDPIIYIN